MSSALPLRIRAALSSRIKLRKPQSISTITDATVNHNLSGLVSSLSLRTFSSKGGGGGGDGDGDNSSNGKNTEDPFGVHFQDSANQESGNIGPKDSLPPNYIRDSATGKFTGEIQAEATYEEKRLLNLDPMTKGRMLSERFQGALEADSKDSSSSQSLMANVARRIREEEIAMNTLGRKVSDVEKALLEMSEDENDDDDIDIDGNSGDDDDEIDSSAPLSADELETLHNFMKKTTPEDDEVTAHLIDESKDLIPSVARMSSSKTADAHSGSGSEEENPDLNLDWMTAQAQRRMAQPDLDDEDLQDPFSHLSPGDLNPAKKVNRRRAKPIPKELLQHNNLSLLRRYVTPGGQIMNRIQSRLGAKDQRKVAKLIKRARHLGLIPVLGQWKVEDHGNTKDPSIFEDTDWEKRLIERGLVESRSTLFKKMASERGSVNTTVNVHEGKKRNSRW